MWSILGGESTTLWRFIYRQVLSFNMHSIRIACRRWYNINPHLCRRTFSSTAASSPSPTISTSSSSLHYDRDTGIIWEKTLSLSNVQKKPIYQTIIGIEIHAQLSIPTKLFSSAPTRHHSETNNNNINNTSPALPNTNVHPYDIAYPGTLPSSPSIQAIQSSILASAALNCNINSISRFERKHYFYPDLPTGYQITQQRWPLASDGMIKFMPTSSGIDANVSDRKMGKKKKRRRGGSLNDDKVNVDQKQMQDNKSSSSTTNIIEPVELRIERIQLEQDTGKTTTHTVLNDDDTMITKSYIDYNRAGRALIEIVSHPDLRSAHEASGAVEHIRKLLKHVGSCDGRMEEGSLRCDLNVSIAPIVDDERNEDTTNSNIDDRQELPLNTGERVEVKNLNSLRQIITATEYEALRQSALAQNCKPTGRETRTWSVKPTSETHPLGGETFCIRAKGDAIDYRFMPEPDLPPLVLDGETLGYGSSDKNMSLEEYIDMHMPESAEDAKLRLVSEYGLTEDVAAVITGDPPAIALFELTVETAKSELESTRSEEIDKAADMKKLSTLAANWLCNDLFALVKKSAVRDIDESSEGGLNHLISVEYSTVDGQRLGALIAMLVNDLLTTPMAKKVLAIMYDEEEIQSHPKDIAKVNGWEVISDMETLIQLCQSVVLDSKNAGQLEQYKLGGKKVWKIEKFFVGKIMGASKGNAHPERMNEALSIVLSKVGL